MNNRGRRVEVEFIGTFDDGTVFDSSEKHGKPLAFVCDSGQMIKGFDDAVATMEIGEKARIHLEPEDGYGPHKEDGIQVAPRHAIPGTENLSVGDMCSLQGKDGRPWPAKVVAIDDESISFDMNHPLAGKALNYEITLLTSEETESGVSEHHHH